MPLQALQVVNWRVDVDEMVIYEYSANVVGHATEGIAYNALCW